jgi:hypothetical protein
MSEDKRRYLSRHPRNTEKPIKATGGKNAAADGYTIRHREPLERKTDGYIWQQERDVSPGLRDPDALDPYFLD